MILNERFIGVMVFYAVLTYLLSPFVAYLIAGEKHLGTGFIVGSILSILLWFFYGRGYVRTLRN